MIENVNQADEATILIYAAVAPWQHVRLMGEDMVDDRNDRCRSTIRLRPVDLGALAGCGHQQVICPAQATRVAIIPTGQRTRALS